jgi:hypothetical protein
MQLSALIIANGIYKNKHETPPLAHSIQKVPKNIRLFYYNFHEIDYDNYYLSQIYNKTNNKTLFFVNKNTGKLFKKEFKHKEYSPGDTLPKGNIVLSFGNIKYMMGIDSFINHPNGFKQDFHNNGKGDTFIITLDELLQQLSKQYSKTFPDEVVEMHLSAHISDGKWRYPHGTDGVTNVKGELMLYDGDKAETFTVEERQNMEKTLLDDFIVVSNYPQAKYAADLIVGKKLPTGTILNKTRSFFSKYRVADSRLKTYHKRGRTIKK